MEDPVGKSRMSKKVTKLEKKADKVRGKAEKKGKDLQGYAADRIEELSDDKGGKKGLVFLLMAAAGAAAAVLLKRKRDQELDEALWEEPRSI